MLLASLTFVLACSTKPGENENGTADSTALHETSSTAWLELDTAHLKVYEPDDTIVKFTTPPPPQDINIWEKNNLKTDSLVKRIPEGLQFRLRNNTVKLLKENKQTDGDDYLAYTFVRTLDDVDQWLVMASYYESFDYVLVDQNDGTENHLWGEPVFSPDKKYFITSQVDLEAGFVPNGFQLWSAENNKPLRLWELIINDWGADKLIWTKNNFIIGEQTYRDEASGELKQRVIKIPLISREVQ